MNDPEVSRAISVIQENSPVSEGYDEKSFVGRLDEEGFFDAAPYRALEAALVCLSGQYELAAEADRHVFCIFRRIALDFACHRDPHDVYRIENLDADKAVDLMNRIDVVFQCYFDRTVPDLAEWSDAAYEAAVAAAGNATPNPFPAWLTRGKSIEGLIDELSTFEDRQREVRISTDMGATHYPVGLIVASGEHAIVLTTDAAAFAAEAGTSTAP